RHLDATLFQVHRRRAEWRFVERNAHLPDEPAVKQGRKGAGIDHEPGRRAVNRTIDIKIVALAHPQRHLLQTAILDTRRAAWRVRIDFQNEQLLLAIENGPGREKNVGPEDPIDFFFVQHARGMTRTAKIDRHYRLVDEV